MSLQLIDRLKWAPKHKLPYFKQLAPAEASLMCLAMIAVYHGQRLNLAHVRSHVGVLFDNSVHSLLYMASRLGMSARTVSISNGEFEHLKLPAVLRFADGHYVVLRSITKSYAVLHDPAIGLRKLSPSDLRDLMSETALELIPNKKLNSQEDQKPKLKLNQFWNSLIGLKRYLFQLLLLSFFLQAVSLLSPLYLQLVVDEALTRNDKVLLNLLGASFLILAILQSALTWFRSWALVYLGNVLAVQIQTNLIRHLLLLPINFFAKRHVGDVISRVGATAPIHAFLTNGLLQSVSSGFMLVSTLAMIIIFQPLLATVAILQLLFYAGARIARFKAQHDLSMNAAIVQADSSNHLIESIRNIVTIKMFGFEYDRLNDWQNHNIEATNSGIRIGRLNLGFSVFNKLTLLIGNILVVYFGAHMIMEGTFTIGMLMAFSSYQIHFVTAGADLIDQLNSYKLLGVSLNRLADIALTETEEANQAPRTPLSPTDLGPFTIRDVVFRYSADSPPLLKNINLTVGTGEGIAIIGASGAGKSTLIRIMLGIEKPEQGSISFSGIDINEIGLRQFRGIVAAVTQEDRLFSGTIADNITMFNENPDFIFMQECAKHCRLHQVITKLPMGYNSLITDTADILSAGERQRLLLTRALYKKPRLLLLDEVTSNLDRELDFQINSMLAETGIARIIVTHRVEPLIYADRVFELSNGTLELRKMAQSNQENVIAINEEAS